MAKIFFKTYGCSLNSADSDAMAFELIKGKHEIVSSEELADLVIVNSCAVKKPTETKILKYLRELKAKGKKAIVAGCLAKAMPEKLTGLSLALSSLSSIRKVIEACLTDSAKATKQLRPADAPEKEKKQNALEKKQKALAFLTELNSRERPLRQLPGKSKAVEIIPICSGCLGSCSYCIVKNARGKLFSYSISSICKKAEMAVKNGKKELWITAQDTGCYGLDIGSNIVELLKRLLKIKGSFRIRLGMMRPDYTARFKKGLLEALKSRKLFCFLHLPIQSGSNSILKKMRRSYTIEEALDVAAYLRNGLKKRLTIATDVICGFPGETEKDFEKTINALKALQPDIVNISRFWPRKGTEAASMRLLPGALTKERSRRLTKLFSSQSLRQNRKWLGWKGTIVINGNGTNNSSIGRNYAYKQVVVHGSYKPGQKLYIKVKSVTSFDLRAECIKAF